MVDTMKIGCGFLLLTPIYGDDGFNVFSCLMMSRNGSQQKSFTYRKVDKKRPFEQIKGL